MHICCYICMSFAFCYICFLLQFHYVSLAFCYNCIMSHLYFVKLPSSAPSPNPNWGLRWLYFQLILPATHPDKFKFGLRQGDSQKQSCLFSWIGPIHAFRSILSPAITELGPNKAPARLSLAQLSPSLFAFCLIWVTFHLHFITIALCLICILSQCILLQILLLRLISVWILRLVNCHSRSQ